MASSGFFDEELPLFTRSQAVQEAVEAQAPRAALQIEDVAYSNSATAIAVVIGR